MHHGAGGHRLQDDLSDGLQRDRGGIDHEVVKGRFGRVGTVKAVDVGGAGFVGRTHACRGLLLSDALDHGSLGGPAVRWAVEPHVEAEVLTEDYRRRSAENHARAVGREAADPGLGAAAQVFLQQVGRQ